MKFHYLLDMCDLENGIIPVNLPDSEIDELLRMNFKDISTTDGVVYIVPLGTGFSEEQLERVAEKNHPDQKSPDLPRFEPIYRVISVPGGIFIDADMRTGSRIEDKMYAGYPNLCPEDQTGSQREAIATIVDKVTSVFAPYNNQPSPVTSQQL